MKFFSYFSNYIYYLFGKVFRRIDSSIKYLSKYLFLCSRFAQNGTKSRLGVRTYSRVFKLPVFHSYWCYRILPSFVLGLSVCIIFFHFVCFPQIYTCFNKVTFCQKTLFFTTKNFSLLEMFLFFDKNFPLFIKFCQICFFYKNLFQFMQHEFLKNPPKKNQNRFYTHFR